MVLVNAEVRGIEAIYRPGFNFAKAGAMLLELQDGDIGQGHLDLEPEPQLPVHLTGMPEKLNERFRRGTVTLSSAGAKGLQRDFEMKQKLLTLQYITCRADLPSAKD